MSIEVLEKKAFDYKTLKALTKLNSGWTIGRSKSYRTATRGAGCMEVKIGR